VPRVAAVVVPLLHQLPLALIILETGNLVEDLLLVVMLLDLVGVILSNQLVLRAATDVVLPVVVGVLPVLRVTSQLLTWCRLSNFGNLYVSCSPNR